MFKAVKNASKIKCNIWKKQRNFIYWEYLKDYSKKSVLTLSDYFPNHVVIVNQFTFGRYIKYYKRFLVTENLNSS